MAKRYPYTDSTGYRCSLIKISSEVSRLRFKGNGIEKQTEREDGYYILYVNDLCDTIKIRRYDFNPFCYTIKNNLLPGEAYSLELKTVGEYHKPKKTSLTPSVHVSGQNNVKFTETAEVRVKYNFEFDVPKSQIPGMFDLTLVDGGDFIFDNLNPEANEDQVYDFYIGTYEVTQEQFKAVMGFNPSNQKGNRLPVNDINWYTAVLFCNRLSDIEGLERYYNISYDIDDLLQDYSKSVSINIGSRGYRLPTENEWEFAAKGGVDSKGYIYPGSNELDEIAWYGENSENKLREVGTKFENELYLFDMCGNVAELCDLIQIKESLYPFNKSSDPVLNCVIKGGNIGTTHPYMLKPDTQITCSKLQSGGGSTGFRIARTR